MPPLPSTTQCLISRLNTLSESNKATAQLIQRLAKLDFQPGSLPLDGPDEGDVRLELSAEIHESLKSTEEELELLRQEVDDITLPNSNLGRRKETSKDSERRRLAVLLARLTEDLRSSRSQYRKAQLAAKHNADRAKLKEREALFSNLQSDSSSPSSYRQRKQTQNLAEGEVVAQASADVTSALRRTHQLMQHELSRSRFAQETLEQSTAALADLGDRYSDLNTLLANSRALVSTLLKSNKSDTWYLETTFYILITTVIWLVFRRWLYGPLSWFVFWPLKLVFRILFAIIPIGGASTAAKSSLALTSQSSSSSLIVKSSATGAIPTRNTDPNAQQHYVRVGGGGRGYMPRDDPSPPNSYSQQVGKMAEQNQQQQQQQPQQQNEEVPDHPQFRQQNQQQTEEKGEVRRGDGTVLKESDKPRNPKKKMWEENVEREKYEQGQTGQTAQVDGEHSEEQTREKDEL